MLGVGGPARLVQHGHGPEREIQTGIGPVPVTWVRIRNRGAAGAEDRVRFTSTILAKWARRTRSLDALPPVLCLRGVSTGDVQEALSALLGRHVPTPSPAVVTRLTATWADEYARVQGRDLSARRYVYVWADGVYLQARMEDQAECMLVPIGAMPEGRKALDEIFPDTRYQRCWVHKTANVLNKMPKSVQGAMKADRREIHAAPTRAVAETAIAGFVEKYDARYARAADCLTQDREALLAFFDMPAERWDHLRTTNPIESVFATVRTKGAPSPITAKLIVFKLVMAAAKTSRRLQGENQLPKVVAGVIFRDGIEVIAHQITAPPEPPPSPRIPHSSCARASRPGRACVWVSSTASSGPSAARASSIADARPARPSRRRGTSRSAGSWRWRASRAPCCRTRIGSLRACCRPAPPHGCHARSHPRQGRRRPRRALGVGLSSLTGREGARKSLSAPWH